jgi:hypothetical protein
MHSHSTSNTRTQGELGALLLLGNPESCALQARLSPNTYNTVRSSVKARPRQQLLELGACSSSAGAGAAWLLLLMPHSLRPAACSCVGAKAEKLSVSTPTPHTTQHASNISARNTKLAQH